MGFALVVGNGGYSLAVVCGLLMVVASLVEHRLQAGGLQWFQFTGSRARGLSSCGAGT